MDDVDDRNDSEVFSGRNDSDVFSGDEGGDVDFNVGNFSLSSADSLFFDIAAAVSPD